MKADTGLHPPLVHRVSALGVHRSVPYTTGAPLLRVRLLFPWPRLPLPVRVNRPSNPPSPLPWPTAFRHVMSEMSGAAIADKMSMTQGTAGIPPAPPTQRALGASTRMESG